ncbi:MAG: hypothetical protein OXI40_09105 [Chloroflexota bacterium]|nr:hypothetical protein [Chloroflexota bacterium]
MASNQYLNASGVYPHLALSAELGPPRTECGVGAMMAWAGSLWLVTYVSHKSASGVGTGLYAINDKLEIEKHPASYVGTYTNRMVHWESNQLMLGPYAIDAEGTVRTIESLLEVRTCSTMRHLRDPANKVYVLGMEGEFYELDVHTLETSFIADLTVELGVPDHKYAHFKAAYSNFGRVVVANNSYDERDFRGMEAAGRLAEWDGETWTIIDRNPYIEVNGRGNFAGTIFAMGWDKRSAILQVYTEADSQWKRYRLPKASHCFDHMWQTEWPRIREVEHERFLMDCHGMFYELSPWAYENRVWGIRPISTHLWVHGDFCAFRGMLVLGSDNASPHGGANHLAGEPQSGLWFGKTDDLWNFGKPAGWGGVWQEDAVEAGQASDPYLMTGFDKKVLHLCHDDAADVRFTVEADFLGNGAWKIYDQLTVSGYGYAHHEFPDGYSAHWVRVRTDKSCVATAYFTYT